MLAVFKDRIGREMLVETTKITFVVVEKQATGPKNEELINIVARNQTYYSQNTVAEVLQICSGVPTQPTEDANLTPVTPTLPKRYEITCHCRECGELIRFVQAGEWSHIKGLKAHGAEPPHEIAVTEYSGGVVV